MIQSWVKLENIIVHIKKSQIQTAIHFHLHEMSRIGKSVETGSRSVVGASSKEKQRVAANVHRVSSWG